MRLTLKEIHRNGTKQAGAGVVELNDYDSPLNYTDKAVVQSKTYHDLFPTTKSCSKLKIVKITNPETGQSIWREVSAYGIQDVNAGDIAMPFNSIWELGFKGKAPHDVEVQRGCCWKFYWKHPVHATRISFHIGIYGIAITMFFGIITLLFNTPLL